MSVIIVFAFVDRHGREDSYTTTNPTEAHDRAQRLRMQLLARTFEFADQEMVADYSGVSNTEDTHASNGRLA